MKALEIGIFLLGSYFFFAMLLGVANVVRTISFLSQKVGTSNYYRGSAVAEKIGKILHYVAIVLMLLAAVANQFVLIRADVGGEIVFFWFAFFPLYLIGVTVGGGLSYFIITRLFKVYADTSLIDDMVSC